MPLFAAYTDLGGGLLFLFALAILAPALGIWTFYWTVHGFRGRLPRGKSFSWWFIRCFPILAVVICFPASRQSANWHLEATQQPIPPSLAYEYDRFLFGYRPNVTWIGSLGHEGLNGSLVQTHGRGQYSCSRSKRVVDWMWLFPQLGILVLVSLPIFGRRSRTIARWILDLPGRSLGFGVPHPRA